MSREPLFSLTENLRDGLFAVVAAYAAAWVQGWNQFWFTPTAPHVLAIIRIACGAMLAYVHAIWASMLPNFMGSQAWINSQTIDQLHQQDWVWSWLFGVENINLLIIHQLVAVAASLCMCLGLATRVTVPLAWWMTLMVCHRMTGALFGLDQVVMMLTMYLMLSHCGSVWSIDARLARKNWSRWLWPEAKPSIINNVATRLIQLHLCVIYLFGGLSKMRGEMWWDGSAMWFSLVNYEYQSLNLTWLGHFPIAIGLLTAITIFWETFYCALIWPRLTRPIVLAIALMVHGGIAIALGMWTFGTMMIVANFIFLPSEMLVLKQKTNSR
jgi:hypothetical protein